MTSVLVTGVAGFIGSSVAAALLREGCRVAGIDNFDPFYSSQRKRMNIAALEGAAFTLHEADLCDRAKAAAIVEATRPDVIIHLAALAGVRPSIASPDRYAAVNVLGTVSVLDAARAAGVQRIVFASSSSVYGNNRKVPFAEDDRVDEPISPYAATKRSGELICHSYALLFGLRIAILRFFTVYGPAQRPDLAITSFMERMRRDEEIPVFGDGGSSRDYTYVDDIVQGVQSATEWTGRCEPGGSRIFNLGNSTPVALRDMIETISRAVGRAPRIRPMPAQPGDVERTCADLSRSRAELSYEPRISFEEGIARQWAWVRDRQFDG